MENLQMLYIILNSLICELITTSLYSLNYFNPVLDIKNDIQTSKIIKLYKVNAQFVLIKDLFTICP